MLYITIIYTHLGRFQLVRDEPVMNLSSYSETWHAILPHNQLEEVDHRPHSVLLASWVNAVDFAM